MALSKAKRSTTGHCYTTDEDPIPAEDLLSILASLTTTSFLPRNLRGKVGLAQFPLSFLAMASGSLS